MRVLELLEDKRSFLFNTDLPKLSEVEDVLRKARAASAPGLNGISYKLYKYCQGSKDTCGSS